MARKRHEFDLEGVHYTSLKSCLMNSRRSRAYIYKHRTNLKEVLIGSDIVIKLDIDKEKAKEIKTDEMKSRMKNRIAVEDYQQEQDMKVLLNDEGYYDSLI